MADPLAPPAVLLVDDSATRLDSLESALQPLGLRLVRADSVATAASCLDEDDFAVVLLDLHLRRRGGPDAAARVRERARRTPVVLLVEPGAPDDVSGLDEAGAVDCLSLPLDPVTLRAKVSAFVDLHRSHAAQVALQRRQDEAQLTRRVAQASALAQQALAEVIPQQVWTARPDGTLDHLNRAATDYFGRGPAEGMGAGRLVALHPDDAAGCEAQWAQAVRTGEPFEAEFRLRRHDGVYRWHMGRATAVRDGAGGPVVRWVGTHTDIDDRRQVEAALLQQRATLHESDERLRLALEAGQLGTWEWHLPTRRVTWSPQMEALHGLAAGTFAGTFEAAARDMHPDDRAQALARVDQSLRGEGGQRQCYRIIRPDGAVRWLETHAQLIRDEAGQPLRLVGICSDVTERNEAEGRARQQATAEAQRTRQEQYTALRADVGAALSHDGPLTALLDACCVAIVQRLGVALARVWLVNDEAQQLELEASAGLYQGQHGPHSRVPLSGSKIGRIARERRAELTNDVAHDPDAGDPTWVAQEQMVAFAGYPLVANDRCLGVVAALSREPLAPDTLDALAWIAGALAQGAARKLTEVALAERAEALARSNQDLEHFAYLASHDLQEPLRMVTSYTQLLARRYRGKLDADADEFIGFAVDGVQRMQALINDLLAFSRVGTRGKPLVLTSLQVPLDAALANLRTTLAEAGAAVTHDDLPALPLDPGQLAQVFQNLLANGVKFHGDAPPRLHVGVVADGGDWQVSVKDNGIGIAPEFQDKLFVLFQHLHHRTEYAGNGIGLAICKRIIERHGGRIWVESSLGQGTTFSFTLKGAT
jgi:PAS domain S-box-containing protein